MGSEAVELWRRDFRNLWIGETISMVGSEVTELALPLTAIITLGANAAAMGQLVAIGYAPLFLLGLPSGVIVEHIRRRPILIGADLARMGLLLSIPVLAWLGQLRIFELYVIAFALGSCRALFDVSYVTWLPSLVPRHFLPHANGRMEASRAGAQVVGPSLAGPLVQFLSAPGALLFDALSFLASGLAIGLIRTREPAPHPAKRGRMRELLDGFHLVRRDRLLRALVPSISIFNFSASGVAAVYLLYVTRRLGVGTAVIGGLIALGGLVSVGVALSNARIVKRFGIKAAILAGMILAGLGDAGALVAGGASALLVSILAVAQIVGAVGKLLDGINVVTLVQLMTPSHILARVTATTRSIYVGTIPLGALCGGAVAQAFGIRWALGLGAVGEVIACLVLAPFLLSKSVHLSFAGTAQQVGVSPPNPSDLAHLPTD